MKKVTIQEIADFSGVSKFAVSRALSGKPGVSAQTREMILKAAGQLGYFKDSGSAAASRVQPAEEETGRTGAVLVLFPNIRYQNTDSPYWGPVFSGITARLNQKGMDVLTLTEPSSDSMFSLLNPQAIGGILTVGSVSTQVLLDIKKLGIPVVMVDHQDPAFRSDTVFTDNAFCMQEMMVKLISKGYRSFQFAGNIQDAQSYKERWMAFRSALADCNLKHEQIPELISPEMEHMRETLEQVFNVNDLPEVLVCANDLTASLAVEVMEEKGIRVPEQLQVTGFDNTYEDLPILATVNVNKELIGSRSVDKLLWRMAHPDSDFEKLLIQAPVIFRDL